MFFYNYIKKMFCALESVIITNNNSDNIELNKGFIKWCDLTLSVQKNDNALYIVGNGASASMASHMSSDAAKSCGIRSLSFNDIAMLTAVSNDISYKQSFAKPLEIYGKQNDMLITISSSGNSPNIIEAIKIARKLGIYVVTLSGMNIDNLSRKAGDLNFYVPEFTYGLVESCHQTVLHCWLDMYMEKCLDIT